MSKSVWIHIIFGNACSTLGLWVEKIGGSENFLILIPYLGPLVHSVQCHWYNSVTSRGEQCLEVNDSKKQSICYEYDLKSVTHDVRGIASYVWSYFPKWMSGTTGMRSYPRTVGRMRTAVRCSVASGWESRDQRQISFIECHYIASLPNFLLWPFVIKLIRRYNSFSFTFFDAQKRSKKDALLIFLILMVW